MSATGPTSAARAIGATSANSAASVTVATGAMSATGATSATGQTGATGALRAIGATSATGAESSCKGCREEYTVTDAQIARILAGPMFSSPDVCVSDEVYQSRLAACQSCPKLEGSFTCRACGCIIPVVAKLKQRGCPLPGGGLWQAVASE